MEKKSRRCIAIRFLWVVFVLISEPANFSQATPTVKQAPPPGISLPSETASELRSGLDSLGREIEALRKSLKANPDFQRLLPDIEIFHKAVRYAVEYGEFFKPREIEAARAQLALGLQRCRELAEGKPAWQQASGPVVRGYLSKIDDSVQPYGLMVPGDWKPTDLRPRALYLWFHGRDDTLSEVSFISAQLKGRREFAPAGAFELHLYGRYCNASKFAGETDAFEALADVMSHYKIDTNRIAEMGFSMGGASAWHMAAHHAGLWAAASAGAGFAETAVYAHVLDPSKAAPPQWEQTLWRWYDATLYAANFADVPMIAYSGEIDPQKQSADIMEKFLEQEGLKLERLIGPKTAHKYEPETKKILSQRLDALIAEGRDPFPQHVRFVTYTLRYNQMKWVTIDQLEKHWERSEINGLRIKDGFEVQTKNITAFSIDATSKSDSPERPLRFAIDDQKLSLAKRESNELHFRKTGGKWQHTPATRDAGLRKTHGLTGPVDDAFMDSFVFIRPTGKAWNETVGSWSTNELDLAIAGWRRVFRGDAQIETDHSVTDKEIADSNLILWGDPGSNALLAKILPRLPLEWNKEQLTIGSSTVSAKDHAPILIFPNPLNPKRYVVLNSGFTFRQGSTTSNSLQTPKLPDWALVDLRTAPNEKWPGKIANAGFFNEQWQLP
jgi:hypothetical protein